MGFWFGWMGLESDHLATEARLKNSEWQYWKGNDSKVPSWETSNTSLYQRVIQDITQQVATDISYHLNTKHIPGSASEMRSLHFLFNIVNMTCCPFRARVRTFFLAKTIGLRSSASSGNEQKPLARTQLFTNVPCYLEKRRKTYLQ